MIIQKRTLGWLPRPSLYNEQAAARAKQKATHQDFMSNSASFQSSFSSIQSDYTSGITEIVSNIALTRMGYNKKA
jgi:hypothetical protein